MQKRVVKRAFYQSLSILAFVKSGTCNKQVPLVFILMSGKRRSDYVAVLKSIIDLLPRSLVVCRIVLDFEAPMWEAVSIDRSFYKWCKMRGNPPAGSGWQPPAGSVPGVAPGYQPHGNPVTGAVASAPPMNQMEPIPGYNPDLLQGVSRFLTHNVSFPVLNEESAREALLDEVSHHCCYGKTAAQELEIVGLVPNVAFHYILESFTESRVTNWAVEPYQGHPIDGPHNGPAPTPWEVQVIPQQNFKDSTASVEVPHTATVKELVEGFVRDVMEPVRRYVMDAMVKDISGLQKTHNLRYKFVTHVMESVTKYVTCVVEVVPQFVVLALEELNSNAISN
ncbi:hypothetical protein LSH36_18g06023 [Paralvinella palmiformis]|uniref:Uncharacterized protein n=1 Tax=Paralvinella palmiformis TaxID=53620 RepID=A0AAD9KBU5_9ANNE|nr:hypothetical protein LSH36_18g06023 [Paralvinella palmiformis]